MVQMESEAELTVGDPAPEFELPNTDGDPRTLSSYADDDAVLLVFTCNHCPYAKAKFETMNDLAAEYDAVSVVGVNPNDEEEYPEDSAERMRELVEGGTLRWDDYLRDASQEVARAYDATCTPDPFLLRKEDDGFVLAWHGRFDDALNPDAEPSGEPGADMRDAIDSVLAGEAVEKGFLPSRGCSIKWKE